MRYLVISFALLLAACNNNNSSNSSDPNDTTAPDTTRAQQPADASPISGCYMQVLKRDTFVARLDVRGDSITGKLSFDNYQKDGSSGSVRGIMEDGIIKLVYDFHSEGMQSVMDIYFKHAGDSLVRGIGVMQTRGDTAYFEDPGAIEFSGSVLRKMPCIMVPAKYK